MEIKNLPIFGYFVKILDGNDIEYGYIATGTGVVMAFIFFTNTNVSFGAVLSLIFLTSPLWLFYITIHAANWKWLDYKGKWFYLFAGRTTLEIKIPQEIMKSPRAMENVLSQLWNAGNPDNFWQTYIDGKRAPRYGLEIVSNGGDIRFYINTCIKKFKNVVEAQLYAQYPGVEVHELSVDYAAAVDGDPEKYEMYAAHMQKKEPEVFPIGTYIDFGLDDMPKEEEKTDPFTIILDHLASLGPHERLWIQYIIEANSEPSLKKGNLGSSPKESHWKSRVKAKIDDLMYRDSKTKSAPLEADGQPRLTLEERATADALERSYSKKVFKVGIRYIYIADKGHYVGTRHTATNRIFGAFDIIGRNEIGQRWRTDFNYIWLSDPFGKRMEADKQQELTEYKLRKYNNKKSNDADGRRIFSTEELASLYHLPGKVAITPTLGRIPSTKGTAPQNLPIETQVK